jgi:ketosteroid isomerase-like protein
MNSRPVLLLLIVMLLAAPIQTAPVQSVPAQTPSDSKQRVSSVLDKWSKYWKARDADAIAALYAPDAIVCPAVGRRINPKDTIGDFQGPKAIRDYFKPFFERLADPKIGDFVIPGPPEDSQDLAFDDGFLQYLISGKCRPADVGDGPCVMKGFFLMVLKRGSDGRWLIVRQTFTQIGLGSTIYTPH